MDKLVCPCYRTQIKQIKRIELIIADIPTNEQSECIGGNPPNQPNQRPIKVG